MPQNYEVFRAGGSKGPNVRADGNGGFMARGFYYRRLDETLAGPFDTAEQAELVMFVAENSRRSRCHESELTTGEQSALRALRRKGVIAAVGLYLTPAYRAACCTLEGANSHSEREARSDERPKAGYSPSPAPSGRRS